MQRLTPAPDPAILRPVARVRVLYADTDKMGIVYHGTYLRFLEHGRVELMRAAGMPYTTMEAGGHALPVTDIAVSYGAPARYDDVITVRAALTFVSRTRVFFGYRVVVEPGDREGLEAPLEVLVAQSRHCCVRVPDGRATRLPDPVYEVLRSCYTPDEGA